MTRAAPKRPAPVAPDAADARFVEDRNMATACKILRLLGKLDRAHQVKLIQILMNLYSEFDASAPARGTRRGRGGR